MKELFSDAAECRATALHITSHHITSENLKASLKPPLFYLNEAFFISKFEARSSDHLCRLASCAARRLSRRRKAVLAARRFRCKPLFWDSAVGTTTSCYFRPSRNVCMSVSRWTNFFQDEQTCRTKLKMCLVRSISLLNSYHEEL